jgi:23S rRNA pseudouridine1911/1915/1917 synthase
MNDSKSRKWKVVPEMRGQRLDVALAKAYPKYSRSFLQRLVKGGGVKRGEITVDDPSYHVQSGEIFEIIDFEQTRPALLSRVLPREIDSSPVEAPPILHEDEALLVIDKPAGLVVHPASGHRGRTLIDWLRGHLGSKTAKNFADPDRLGLVHRLDKDTSGVLLIAKSVVAQAALSRQFQNRTIHKTYVAFVEGVPSSEKGVISAPLGRSRKNPTRMAVSNYGRPSETSFEVEEALKEVSQVRVYPKTGRTHQIRVHMAAIGHPIVGDLTYGSKSSWKEEFDIQRPLLHAHQVELIHPLTEKKKKFEAPWPADLLKAQERFRSAAKLALVGAVLLSFCGRPARCEDEDAPAPRKPVHHTTTTSSSPGVSAASFKALKKQAASMEQGLQAMQQTVNALQQQVTTLQGIVENMNAEQRFRDLDHAIAELNAKAVSSGTSVEETKTVTLELIRKMKSQQDAMDQAHEQIERLQRDVIQRRTQMENSGSAPVQGGGKAAQ